MQGIVAGRIGALALAGCSTLGNVCAQPAGPLSHAAWLAGCWAAEGKDAGSQEHWMAPAGGTMIGMSRTVRAGRTIELEFIRISTNSEGQLAYIATPSGQREATFVARSTGAGELVFENPAHDFPQRIIYRRTGDQTFLARIEGARGGNLREVNFPMRRMACEVGR
jgi:hypothetical protein